MNKTLNSLIIVVIVGVVGVASYYFSPGDGYQGFIGKKTYQNEEDVPPWCVKPKMIPGTEDAPVDSSSSSSTEPASRGGSSSNVGVGFGLSDDSYFVESGFSSEDFIRPSFDISSELPDWGSMFEDDGRTPGSAVGPGGDEPEGGSSSEGGDSGDGTVAPGRNGSGGGVSIPNVPVPKIVEGTFDCGCEEDEVFVEALGQSFKCPEPVKQDIVYSEPGKYNITVGTISPTFCSCPEGTFLDWKIFDNTCDPFAATYNDICLGKKFSSKVIDQCADSMKYYYEDGAEGYKNFFKDFADSFNKGYYKCWDKGQCEQFLQDAKAGKLMPNDLGYDDKKAICNIGGFTKQGDWPYIPTGSGEGP